MSLKTKIKETLSSEMYDGNMHKSLRDIGRSVGGHLAGENLTSNDVYEISVHAMSLCKNPDQGKKTWLESVEYGKKDPLPKWEQATLENIFFDFADPIFLGESRKIDILKKPKKEQMIEFLETLFNAEDTIVIQPKSKQLESGKFLPIGRYSQKKCKDFITELRKYDDVTYAIGDYNIQAGAWIYINPTDGKGIKNENITDYRYCLIECDKLSIEQQYEILHQTQLPVATLTNSGGKSLHALVKIFAKDYDEYKKRTKFVYDTLQKLNFEVDIANKNPMRLSRLAGVNRGNKIQELLKTNIGKESFEEWKNYIENKLGDLPEIEENTNLENIKLSDEIINGLLRKGHKMMIAGRPKAGKSFMLMQLAIAIAEGTTWLEMPCTQGKVLYLNLEIDANSFKKRLVDIYRKLGFSNTFAKNIDIWNLRGKTMPMDKLVPHIIKKALLKRYTAIIIDPIYKVLTGDENKASDMAFFCNQFDKLATELGACIIYCHHHSKGSQTEKSSIDRSSGSGVFTRDPDALIDITQKDFSQKSHEKYLEQRDNWKEAPGGCGHADMIKKIIEKDKSTLWEISTTLREFASLKPFHVVFDYPIHTHFTPIIEEKKSYQKYPKKQKADTAVNIQDVIF